jgi:FixJ family two-component response regulator
MSVIDDESVRSAFDRLFRSAGFSVGTFSSAGGSFGGLREREGAYILMDIRMPGATCFEWI